MLDVSLRMISSKGRGETTLTLRTKTWIVCASITPNSC
jgi:hypothetical protein